MVSTWPAQGNDQAFRHALSGVIQNLLNIFGDAAQIAPIRIGIDVEYGLDVVMVEQRGGQVRFVLEQITQQLRCAVLPGALIGVRSSGVQRDHARLGSLHRDLISDAVNRIQPLRRGDLAA